MVSQMIIIRWRAMYKFKTLSKDAGVQLHLSCKSDTRTPPLQFLY